MPYYKKNNLLTLTLLSLSARLKMASVCLLWACSLWSLASVAQTLPNNLTIESAELASVDNSYQLNADFNIILSPEMESAVNKGVVFSFMLQFKLIVPRKYWFNNKITTQISHATLSYHALTRQYLVNREMNKENHQKAFSSLSEAIAELSHLHDWNVLDKEMLDKNARYKASLNIGLDPDKLPKALQLDALSSEEWSLNAPEYQWTPVLQK